MGRFENLLKQFEPTQQGDAAIFPDTPRNAIADMLPEDFQHYLAESLADQKQFAQDFPEQVAGATMGITKAEKVLGRGTGKFVNAAAAKVKDASPQAEHLRNLPIVREFVESPKNFDMIGKGVFQKVYSKPDLNKVVKDRYNKADLLPNDDISDQLIYNKLDEINANPNTKSYKTSNTTYQVQDKLNLDKNSPAMENDLGFKMKEKFGHGIVERDLHSENFGLKDGVPKILDVGSFSIKPHIVGAADVEKLGQTMLKPNNMSLDGLDSFLNNPTFNQLITDEGKNLVNEMHRLKMDKKK